MTPSVHSLHRFLLIVAVVAVPLVGFSAPMAGPEFSVGRSILVGAPNTQISPAIAFNGTNYLVIWDDYRGTGGDSETYATRVSLDGSVLDSEVPIVIPALAYVNAIASDGTDFLCLGSRNYNALLGRLVKGDGSVQPTNSFDLPIGGDRALAFNGTNYLVVWTTETEVRGARVDRTGPLLDGSGFTIAPRSNSLAGGLSVAKLGNNWIVVWSDSRQDGYGDIFGALVSPAGTVLTTNAFVICGINKRQHQPIVAGAGDTCLVVWKDARAPADQWTENLYGARVNSSGQVLDASGIPYTYLTSASRPIWNPSLASDGTNWMLLCSPEIDSFHSRVSGAKITAQGAVTWFNVLSSTVGQYCTPAIAFGQTNYFGVWDPIPGSEPYANDIVGSRISSSGAVLDAPAVLVSAAPNRQLQPAAATDGTNFLLVWSDGRRGDGQWDIYGARVGPNGQLLDPEGFAITTLPTAETVPSVAFDGTCYLVVWEDSRVYRDYHDIYAARVTVGGQVLDTNGFRLSQSSTHDSDPSVASNGKNFLVCWATVLNQYSNKLSYARVLNTGQISGPGENFIASGYSPSRCNVTTDGTNYLLSWSGYPCGTKIIDDAGNVIRTNLLSEFTSGEKIAGGGGGYLMTFQNANGIYGRPYTSAGAPSGAFDITTPMQEWRGYSHAIAGNTRDFLLAYGQRYFSTNIYLTQITRTGRVIDSNILVVAHSVNVANEITLAGSRGTYLLAYTKSKPFDIARLYARILQDRPQLVNERYSGGRFSMTLQGPAERIYEIEESSDLNVWVPAGQVTNVNGEITFEVDAALPARSYRSRTIE